VVQRGLSVREGGGHAVHDDLKAPDAELGPGALAPQADTFSQGKIEPVLDLEPGDCL
jgi:hypothetical protein